MKILAIIFNDLFASLHGNNRRESLAKVAQMGHQLNLICMGRSETERTLGSMKVRTIKLGKILVLSWIHFWFRAILTIKKFGYENYDAVILDYPCFPISLVIKTKSWLRRSDRPVIVMQVRNRPVISTGLKGFLLYVHYRLMLSMSKYFADGICTSNDVASTALA